MVERDDALERTPEVGASVSARRDVADSLAELSGALLALEREAAQLAFGDASGESEGEEGLLYTTILSSVRVAEIALSADSTVASSHIALSLGLIERSYRGFGVFDTLDLSRAERHLRDAIRILPINDPRRSMLDSALLRVVHNRRPQ
jgi:hypothetical protein